MTREEILNGMSEEEFYEMYPTQEDWENAQQMKLGGLSGAPHNGQPTANEFFSYGSHANDAVNVPMSNPFFAANGGTPYYGGPTRPYDMGGNTASPMNYGAFNIPMQYGGYEEEYGGALDPGNNQDYPILEEGGRANLMAMIKAHSKKMKKAYKEGGDTVMQGGNSDDYPTNLTNTFKNVLKQNMYNHMINEEEQALSKSFMQMGGYQGQGMNYNTTTFNEKNPQNQAIQNMYKQRISDYDTDFQNNMGNFSNAMYDLNATANPYTQTTVKAGVGLETETPRTMSQEEWEWFDEQRKAKENEANYNKYFGKNRTSTRGMDYFPMNYNPYNKISRKDVAMMQQLAKNPTTNLKEFKHNHFGPWGRTKMTFGYKDLYEDNMKIKDVPSFKSSSKNSSQNISSSQDTLPSSYVLRPGVAVDNIYTPERQVLNFPYSPIKQGPSQNVQTKEEATKGQAPFWAPTHSPIPMTDAYAPGYNYGGLTKAQYGIDHKSTNPADGLYDNAGKKIDSESNNMNPVKMEPINALPTFSNSINEQGLKLKEEQSHLKDPSTGSMFVGPEKQATITSKQRPGYNGTAAAATMVAGIDLATSAINKAKDKSKQGLADSLVADNAYLANPANAQSQGGYDQWGNFELNQKVPVQFAGYSAYGGSTYQDGGMQEQGQQEQVMQGVAQMLQQGAQPEQVAQQLVQMGIPQEQAVEIIKAVMQQLQGGQEQQMQPGMRYGGYAMGGYQDEDSYEDDLDEDEIAELKRQGYNVEYLD